MSERTANRTTMIASTVAIGVVAVAAFLAIRDLVSRDSPGDPRQAVLNAVEQLGAADSFTATTVYTPRGSAGAEYTEVVEHGDGDLVRITTLWEGEPPSTTRCSPQPFSGHWLGRFGSPIEGWTLPGAAPANFGWASPGQSISFDYLDLSVDSRVTVSATAWVSRQDGRLTRIERDISDNLGFHGLAVTTFDYSEDLTCF